MCEAAVFFDREGKLEKVMDDVVEMRPEEGKLLLVDVFGEQKLVSARISRVDLMDHQVILREVAGREP
ncbi:MAG: CooT family nickel-binding protein [Actinobacteria bacterium]|nr:CooT family nickel-binding protein [Actinomycetota bacterium]MDI6830725.1 CooT family nickel-binding protein [Actinomycetota bacterium]